MDKMTEIPKNGATIIDLPVEVLEVIFSYMDAVDLLFNVRLVCKRFAQVLSDEFLWSKLFYRVSHKYGVCPEGFARFLVRTGVGTEPARWKCALGVSWRDIVYHFSRAEKKWTHSITWQRPSTHAGTVDALKVMNNGRLCISGGRDRLLHVNRVDDTGQTTLAHIGRGHLAWIWGLESSEKDFFYSCGWDSLINFWNIRESDLESLWTCHVPSPAISLACTRGLLAVGLNTSAIVLVDPRIEPRQRQRKISVKQRAVTSLAIRDNQLLSVGDACNLGVYDLRNYKFLHNSIQMPLEFGAPRCLGYNSNIIYVGTTRGRVHLFDADDHFSSFATYDVTQSDGRLIQISSICAKLGYAVVASNDQYIRILVPSDPPAYINTIKMDSPITALSIANDCVGVGMSEGAVSVGLLDAPFG